MEYFKSDVSRKYKILGCTLGSFSGSNRNLFTSLNKYNEVVDVVDVQLKGIDRYLNVIHSFKQYKLGWKSAYWKTPFAFTTMSKYAEKSVSKYDDSIDIILQTQTLFAPSKKDPIKPYYLYIDYTMKLAEKEYSSWAPFSDNRSKEKWIGYESKVYENAEKIFTFSDHTKNSIIEDYGIDTEIKTVYAGPNLAVPEDFEKEYNHTILFVGKDFKRKGGDTLLKAFKKVKLEIPDAKLIIAGTNIETDVVGVINKGTVSENQLKELYKNSSAFVMPSICEPFGIVFLEAMSYKCPCIGSDRDAMPEIIEDGKTGFIAQHNNTKELADKIIYLLEDKDLMKKLGINARRRLLTKFSWDLTAREMFNN